MLKLIFSIAKRLMANFKPKPKAEKFTVDLPKPKEKPKVKRGWIERLRIRRRDRQNRAKIIAGSHEAHPTSPIQPLRRIRPLHAFYSSSQQQKPIKEKE